ncbi:putative leucine-rich repeat-containing protein DDB_G0290503, partial [Diaphorina citri]|uniref:Leucine-rich repeat-containing protein DDB_G0290503 n=1 Tax=Diaphorina citri TaxID=121845 RepID=A0A3Q0JK46_DIACI
MDQSKDELIAKYESEKTTLEQQDEITFKATLTQREERMKEVLKENLELKPTQEDLPSRLMGKSTPCLRAQNAWLPSADKPHIRFYIYCQWYRTLPRTRSVRGITRDGSTAESSSSDQQERHGQRLIELLVLPQEGMPKSSINSPKSNVSIFARSQLEELRGQLVTENEYKEEMLTTLRHNAELTSGQLATLEKTSQSYRESLIKNETVVSALHEQLKTVSKQLATAEIQSDQYRREVEHLNEKLRDMTSSREVLTREKNMHAQLMSHIEAIKTQMQLSESMGKAKLESKLEDALKEVNGLRHKLTEEQNMHVSKVEMLNKNLDTLKTRVEEETEAKTMARQELEKIREVVKVMEKEMAELRIELDNAKTMSVSSGEKDKQVDQLKYEMMKIQAELKESQNLVAVTKQNEKSIQEICATFEKHNRDLSAQLRTAEATQQAKVAELTKQVETLTQQVREKEKLLSEQPVTPRLSNAEDVSGEVDELRHQLEQVREQLRQSEMEKEKAVASYFRELQLHANDSQSLPKLTQELSEMKSTLQTLENEKQAVQAKLTQVEHELRAKQGDVEAEKTRVRQELEEVRTQNETLYKALDELSTQCNQSLNEIENSSSFSEDTLRGNENVISVIKHLRQQTSLARIDKQNIECENRVLKSDLEMLKRKLNESNELLNAERNKNKVNEKTLEKHAELVKKIEMMEVMSD